MAPRTQGEVEKIYWSVQARSQGRGHSLCFQQVKSPLFLPVSSSYIHLALPRCHWLLSDRQLHSSRSCLWNSAGELPGESDCGRVIFFLELPRVSVHSGRGRLLSHIGLDWTTLVRWLPEAAWHRKDTQTAFQKGAHCLCVQRLRGLPLDSCLRTFS